MRSESPSPCVESTLSGSDWSGGLRARALVISAFEGFLQFLRLTELQPGLLPNYYTQATNLAYEKLARDLAMVKSIFNLSPISETIEHHVRILS